MKINCVQHGNASRIICLILFATFFNHGFAQTNTWDGSSSNNWNTAANWSLNAVPTANHNVVVNFAANIVVDANTTINSLTISNNATVTFTSSGGGRTITIDNNGSAIQYGSSLELRGSTGSGTRSMTIAFSGSGRTMNIEGTLIVTDIGEGGVYNATNSLTTVASSIVAYLRNRGSIVSTATNLRFNLGGVYVHEFTDDAGTIPTATWGTGSECHITGYTDPGDGTTPGGLGQSFKMFQWDCPDQVDPCLAWASSMQVDHYYVRSTGSSYIYLADGSNLTLSLGTLFVLGGELRLTRGDGNATLTAGQLYVDGGVLNIDAGNGGSVINLQWSYQHYSGTITETGSGSVSVVFVDSNNHAFFSGGTVTNTVNYRVNTGSTLEMIGNGAVVTGGGSFTLSSGATLVITSPDGITSSGASGNIRVTGTRTYSAGARYVYNSTVPQNTGNGLPAAVTDLKIDNSGGGNGVTLTNPVTVNGILHLANGLLTTGAMTLSISETGSVFNASATRYVNGKLARVFAGTGSQHFAIGKGGNYRPLTVDFSSLTGTCLVTAEQFETGMTGTLPGGVTLLTTGRYWNITRAGGSDLGYHVTLDATGYSPSNPVVMLKKDGTTITSHATTTPNYTNTTAFTSMSDFALGEQSSLPTTTTPDNKTVCYGTTSVNLTATVNPNPGGGTVQFYIDGAAVGSPVSVNAGNGTAAYNYNPGGLSAANHVIRADFSGYGIYQASSSDPGHNATLAVIASGTWTGTASTDWFDASNWCGGVPAEATDVRIGPGNPHNPVINWGGGGPVPPAKVKNLVIQPGGQLRVAGGNELQVSGDLQNNGQLAPLAPGAGLRFKGGAQQVIGNFPDSFFDVFIDCPGLVALTGTGPWDIRNLNLVSGSLDPMSATLNIWGDWTNNSALGAFMGNTEPLSFRSSVAANQVGGSFPTIFTNLKIDNAFGINLDQDIVVNNTLEFINGSINTGIHTITLSHSCWVDNYGPDHFINGSLRYQLPAGPQSRMFFIGNAGNYCPVSVILWSLSTGGFLTASTAAGDHTAIGSSGIDPLQSVNRTWTLSPDGLSGYDAEIGLNWVSGDMDLGADFSSFIVGKYDDPNWSLPAVTDRSASSITCNGITSLSDFQVGEPGAPPCNNPDIPVLSATPNPVCQGSQTSLSVVSGNLNSATDWHWYSGSCGGAAVGTGVSINVSPAVTTTYYARGEGGCVTPGSCAEITVTVLAPGTWTGAVSTAWNEPGNWCGGVPTFTTNVIIPALPANQPVIACFDPVYVNNIQIDPGATLSNQGLLLVNGNFINNGNYTDLFPSCAPGIGFAGTGVHHIGGSSITSVMYLLLYEIQHVILDQDILVREDLYAYDGDVFDLNGHAVGSPANPVKNIVFLTTYSTNPCSISGGTIYVRYSINSFLSGPANYSAVISADIVMTGTAFQINMAPISGGGTDLTISGALSGSGPVSLGGSGIVMLSGQNTFTGNIYINNGILKLGAAGSGGNGPLGTTDGGTLVGNGGTLDLNGLTLTNSETLTLNGTGAGNVGALWNSSSSQVWWNGGVTLGGNSLVGMNGSIILLQGIGGGYNLDVAGNTKTLTLAGTTSGVNNLTIQTGSSLVATGTTVVNITGNLSCAGSYTNFLGTVNFNGTAEQGLSGANNFKHISMNNPAGISLNGGTIMVNGNVDLLNGRIRTNAWLVDAGALASFTGGNAGSYIQGRVRKMFTPTYMSALLPVGDATTYAPVEVQFTAIGTSGSLAVSTAAGDHAQISSSGIDPAKTVNRTWSFTTADGLAAYAANLTLNWAPGDLDGGAEFNDFVVKKYAGVWTMPDCANRTAGSIDANGITSFSDFQVGELCQPADVPVISAGENPLCPGSSGTSLSISSGNLNDATHWQWYSGSCGGTAVGTGVSINISPTLTTTYYARGEGGCVTPGSCGNITLVVEDVTSPSVSCKNTSVALDASGQASIVPADVYQSGSDNCGTVNLVSVTPNSFNCSNIGSNPVVLTVNDGNSNSASCTATVTVVDNFPPVPNCPVSGYTDAVFTSEAGYLAAVNGLTTTTEDFNNLTYGGITGSGYSMTNGGVTYTFTAPPNGIWSNAGAMSTTNSYNPLITTFSGDQVYGFGGWFTGTNMLGNFMTTTVTLASGAVLDYSFIPAAPNQFVGFTFTDPVVSFSLDADDGNGLSWSTLDHFVVSSGLSTTYPADPGQCVASLNLPANPTDNCGVQNTVYSLGGTPLTFPYSFPVGSTTVDVMVTDVNNNTAACSYFVVVNDLQDPVPDCPVPSNPYPADAGQCYASLSLPANPTDNCGVQSSVYTVNGNPITFPYNFPVGSTTVDVLVTDVNDNTSACSYVVTVIDNENPMPNCPSSGYSDAVFTSEAAYLAALPDLTTTTEDFNGFTYGGITGSSYSMTNGGVTYTFTAPPNGIWSNAGAMSTTNAYDPLITTFSGDQVYGFGGWFTGTNMMGVFMTTTVTLASGAVLDYSFIPAAANQFVGFTFADPVVSFSLDADDGNGLSWATLDHLMVSSGLPNNYHADAGQCYKTIGLPPNPTDNCGVQSTVYSIGGNPVTFPYNFPVGSVTVDVLVTDVNNNTAACSYSVTVNDDENPVINCPALSNPYSADAGQCYASLSLPASPTDNCGIQSTVYSIGGNPLAFPYNFPVGSTTVDVLVTDLSNNTAACSYSVLVQDNQPPGITCPQPVNVNAGQGQCYAVISNIGTPQTDDNCGVQNVTNDAPGNSQYPVGTTIITWTVWDVNGNSATCTQAVTVIDNQPPSLSCPPPVSVNADPGQCYATITSLGSPNVSDNCGTQTPANNAPANQQYPVGTTTVTWTVSDVNGNSSTCTQEVTVTDNQPPAISCPSDLTVSNNPTVPVLDQSNTALNAGAGGLDQWQSFTAGITGRLVSIDLGLSSPINGSSSPGTIRIYAGEGTSGTLLTTQEVTFQDINFSYQQFIFTTPPTLTAGNLYTIRFSVPYVNIMWVYLNSNNSYTLGRASDFINWDYLFRTYMLPEYPPCSAVVTFADPIVSDNCPGTITQQTAGLPSGSAFPVGTTTNTYLVTDASNHTANCSFTITVEDDKPPLAACKNAVVFLDASGNGGITVNDIDNGSTDDCGTVNLVSVTPNSFNCSNIGDNTVTLLVNDGNGNEATCTATVTVTDNQPPVIGVSPQTAQELAGLFPGTPDGAYTLYLNGDPAKPFNAYCHDMAGTPVEYITLVNTGGSTNRSQYLAGGAIPVPPNSTVNTNWSKIRFNPLTLLVNTGDYLFSTSTGYISHQNTSRVPFGTARDCYNWGSSYGQANVDLRGTSFAVNDTWSLGGFQAAGTSNFSFNDQVVNVTGGGYCGWNHVTGTGDPTAGGFYLTLEYYQPTHGTDLANPLPVSIVAPNDPGSCSAVVNWIPPTLIDNCPGTTLNCTHNPGDVFVVGTTTVTYTAIDANNNSSTGSFTVTVQDTESPSVTCKNATAYLDANGQASIVPADVYQSGTDNCGTVNLVSVTPNSFNCSNIGNNPVTLLVNDGHGNTATCSAVVTVADNIPPSPVCKNTTAYLDANGQTSIVPADVYQSGSDNCGTVNLVSVTPNSFNCNNIGNNPVTLLVNDGNGNTATCSAVVTVADNIPPSPVCKNTTAYLDANGQASIVPADVYQSGSDNCGKVNLVSVSPNSFTCNNLGSNPVVLTVNDGHGNTATCSAVVTVADNIPPSPVCKNATSYLDADGQASIVPADVYQSGSDNCGTVNLVSVTPNTFTCSNLGNNPVVLTVNDGNGNTASCSATVNVLDDIHPAIICPQGIHVNADPQQCYATVTSLGTPQTDDNCNVANVSNNAPGNNQYPVGTTTVIWTVYDQSGNTATCTQSVTVADNQPPAISCPPDYYAYADNFVCYALILDLGTPQTNDNCGVASVTNDVAGNGLFPVGDHVVTWTVTDVNGNTATCTQDVIVTDNQPPTIMCPQDIIVNTDPGQCLATVSNPGSPGVYDNCGIFSVQNDAPLNGQYAVGNNTVTWYVLDIHGNTTQCSQIVTVVDNQAPLITCPQPITVNADPQQCYATIQGLGTPQTWDNCGVQGVSNNSGGSLQWTVGSHVVTWTLVDIHGNTATCTQTITVLDNQPPWVQCPQAVQHCIAAGQNGEIVNGLAPLSGDNCGIQSVTYQITGVTGGNGSNDASGTFFNAGQSWVIYTVTDVNGNSATCSFSVEIYNRPVASANASPLQLCQGEAFDLLGGGSGGGGGYQYAWTGPNGFSSTDQNPHIPNALATHNGLYQLVVTDDHLCSSVNDASVTVTVWPLPVVGFSGDPANTCLNCPAITLTGGTPSGGTYGGDGVSNDVFDPLAAGPGPHVLTYTYIDGNGCSNSATHNIFVTQSLPEEVTVGTGGDYPTLTGNGGLFEAVNNGALWSNLKVYIISDLQEPGTHALNQWTEDGNGPYSMTIVPDLPVLRNITGNVNLELIRFNGADRVTIDGRYDYEGRYLLFRNLAGFNGTIAYMNDAVDHTIRSCIIEGCNRATNAGVMMIGAGVSSGNNNILITENLFRNANTNNPNNLLSSYSTATIQNSGIQVLNNEFKNFRNSGILVSGIGSGTGWTVDGNSFYYDMATAATTAQTAISFTPASLSNNNFIRNNLIGGNAPYCGGTTWVNSGSVLFRGIYANAGTYTIENNVISNIRMSSTGLGSFTGIDLSVVQGLQSRVKDNTIGSLNLPAAVSMAGTGAFTGILINSSLPVQWVEGNIIANIAYTSVGAGSPAIAGIKANKALLRKNRIYELNATGLNLTPTMYGLWLNGAAGASNECSNNMIAMGGGAVLNPLIYGIYEGSAANTTAKHNYNTVNIYGTASTTKKSYCFYRQNSVNVTIKNNIFSNFRSASPLGQYAIYTVSGTYWTYCDYNDLYSATAPIAGWAGADKATFALWKTATGKDAHSVNVMPVYASDTDLHLMPSNTGIDGKGNPIATYTTDIDGNIRNVATPDIGCDEFTAVLPRMEEEGPQQADLKVYPNPFTSTTSLELVLPEDGVVELGVYNLLGERVGEIHQGMMYRGIHTFSFQAEDLPAGMYLCRLVVEGKKTLVKRMQLLK